MRRAIAGAGGVALMSALFLPWTREAGVSRSGWELWATGDVLFVFAGTVAVAAAVTGGRIGLFRPDVSLDGATDLLGVVSTTLIAWMLFFELPAGAELQLGAIAGLLSALTVTCAAGDYSVLRGAPLFPRLGEPPRDHV